MLKGLPMAIEGMSYNIKMKRPCHVFSLILPVEFGIKPKVQLWTDLVADPHLNVPKISDILKRVLFHYFQVRQKFIKEFLF